MGNDTVQPTSNHPLVNGTEDEQCFNPTYNEHKSSSIQGCKEMEITMTIDISETSHHTHEESLQEEIINVDKDEISMRTSKEPINDNMLNGNLSSEKSMETSNGKINGNIFTAESNEKLAETSNENFTAESNEKLAETSNKDLTAESNENLCRISDIQFITESSDTLANILRSSALQKHFDQKQISLMNELCQQKDEELKKLKLEKAESENLLLEREKAYKMHVVERYNGDVHLLDLITKVKGTIQGNRPLFVTTLQQRNLLNEAIDQLNSSLSSRSRDLSI